MVVNTLRNKVVVRVLRGIAKHIMDKRESKKTKEAKTRGEGGKKMVLVELD